MANPKKRRKIIIFSAIGVVLVALTLVAVFKNKEPVITVQTEKVARRNLTEHRRGQRQDPARRPG